MYRLHPLAMALAFGTLWGIAQAITGLTAALFDYGTPWVALWGSFYPGYAPTMTGALLGLVWGFLDGFVFGYLLIWLFNFFTRHLSKER